jgi:hypothetical protein
MQPILRVRLLHRVNITSSSRLIECIFSMLMLVAVAVILARRLRK